MLVRIVDDDLLDLVFPGARNVVITPITADGEHLGVAVGEWGGGADARIPTSTVRALSQASMHAALAFRKARLLGENERLATRDSLTGLANRRLFDESLQREVARSQRLATPLSLLVLDVDHFKQVNDTYGHQTGDAVLREVADALVANTKNYDVAARYGGDEFVVLLPGCSREDAMGVARACAPRDRPPGRRGARHHQRRHRHHARQRLRRRAPDGRGRRRALRGQAHRPRPRRRLGAQARGGPRRRSAGAPTRAAPDASSGRV